MDVGGTSVAKKESKYTSTYYKKLEKNAKVIPIIQQAFKENNSECVSTKEIWDTLELAYKETSEVKRSKTDLPMSKYDAFNMNKDEK